jgi:hypothetical protein
MPVVNLFLYYYREKCIRGRRGVAGGTVAVSANPPHRMEVGEVRVAEDSDFALLKVINKEKRKRKRKRRKLRLLRLENSVK